MSTVFFSYSHKDETLRDQLEVHLRMLQREGLVETWHDRRIKAGDPLDTSIDEKLADADFILLLASADFLASEYCWGVEVKRAMERHEARQARVIPVILRPCDWHNAPFGKLCAVPKDGKPVTSWPDRDEAFLDVTRSIRDAVAGATRGSRSRPDRKHPPDKVPVVSEFRSSNLGIAKRFSEADRDKFLHDCFKYIVRFFNGSLEALEDRNDGVTVVFRRIDANRFTAAAYREGQKETACTVWIGSDPISRGIRYSCDESGGVGSYSEELGVGAGDKTLHLQALFTSYRHSQSKKKLTMQGAAEYFWDLFIEPMQANPDR